MSKLLLARLAALGKDTTCEKRSSQVSISSRVGEPGRVLVDDGDPANGHLLHVEGGRGGASWSEW